jgi:hypothetical protein
MAEAVTFFQSAHEGAYAPTDDDGQEGSWEPSHIAAGAGVEPAGPLGLLPITQTQRPVEIGTPDGNRTLISLVAAGRRGGNSPRNILYARLSLQQSLSSEERRRLINWDQPRAHGIGNVGPGTVHMG